MSKYPPVPGTSFFNMITSAFKIRKLYQVDKEFNVEDFKKGAEKVSVCYFISFCC